ncbi:hypothetical protein TELCIR_20170, partial [Teladorsagia circumcincta]
SLDLNHSDNASQMGKKKAPLKKSISENLNVTDALTSYKSTSEELARDHKKMKSEELGGNEMQCDCTPMEFQRIMNYSKQSVALIASLGAEIPDFKMKRDRIVDNAKKYVALDEEIYNNLTNTCIAESKAEGRGDEEEQSVIEILFDELVGKDHIGDYATPGGDDSDGNSAAVEWTTASSSEPWDHKADSNPKVASLEKRQQELNELLISERNNYEEKLSCLRSVMEEDKERADALQLSLDELNKKHQEAVAELQRMQGMYGGVVEELGTERAENVRLSDLARCAELETRQIKELARDIEDERSSLRLENIEYAERVRNLESNISTLQASESDHKKRCEELAQRCESLEASFSKEREDLTQQLELLQKTLEEDS